MDMIYKELIINFTQCIYSYDRYFGYPMTPYWKHVYGDSVEKLLTDNLYTEMKQVCACLERYACDWYTCA